jgi:amidophosphoribosyltransferase
MLDRLEPKRIIIVSSAPQIRYPDCYGIDMAKMGDFIAFQAIAALLKRDGKEGILDVVYLKCKEQEGVPKEQVRNYVKEVYEAYSQEEISEMVAKLVTPEGTKAKVSVLFQTIEGLHDACPNNQGDWYFSGNYPTPGGNKVVNKAFINYMEGRTERAY